MIYDRAFFEVQLRFAERVRDLCGLSAEQALDGTDAREG